LRKNEDNNACEKCSQGIDLKDRATLTPGEKDLYRAGMTEVTAL